MPAAVVLAFLAQRWQTERAMRLFDLLAHLRLWPFDSGIRGVEAEERTRREGKGSNRPIVVPPELQPVVQAARWPSEYARRTMH
jgi:hypothetical protein